MKLLEITVLCMVLAGCAMSDGAASKTALDEECAALRERLDRKEDGVLVRATMEENYNHQCLRRHYPSQVQ